MKRRFAGFLPMIWRNFRNRFRQSREGDQCLSGELQAIHADLEGLRDQIREFHIGLEENVSRQEAEVARLAKSHFELAALIEDQNETIQEAIDEMKRLRLQYEDLELRSQEMAKSQAEDAAMGALLKEFLPILDGLEEAIRLAAAVPPAESLEGFRDSFIQGLESLYSKGQRALEGLRIKRIRAIGQPFDPYYHHAIEVVPVGDPGLENVVIREFVAGYTYLGRVIRYAEVGVGKFEERRSVTSGQDYRDRPWNDQYSGGHPGEGEAEGDFGGQGSADSLSSGDIPGGGAPHRDSGEEPIYPLPGEYHKIGEEGDGPGYKAPDGGQGVFSPGDLGDDPEEGKGSR
ncbi:MAG: nucleotide exchange factor GrpE [Firmicutes bacterium]|nr:nucleotide exchange factor GrpE [Bacillota bacterium]